MLSLIALLGRLARPTDAVLLEVPGTGAFHDVSDDAEAQTVPGLIAYRFYAPLFFANADYFVERIRTLIAGSTEPVRWVLVDMQAVTDIDVTAAEAVSRLRQELAERGIALKIARANRPLRERLARIGLGEQLGERNLFPSVHAGAAAFRRETGASGRASRGSSLTILLLSLMLAVSGCEAPIGADRANLARVYRQTHQNPVAQGTMSRETESVLHRFDRQQVFADSPDDALRYIHQKALEGRERGLFFALSELNYLTAENLRHSVKPWETRDARDYYLASAVYAWMFLFGDVADPPPGPFDERLRSACDLYNYSLGWALSEPRGTNAIAILGGGPRKMTEGSIDIDFKTNSFPWPLANFHHFVIADRFLVRGLTVRNRQPGLGAPLVAMAKVNNENKYSRAVPATVLLRVNGGLTNLANGHLHASLELYSAYDETTVQVNGAAVPLETDTTIATAYTLNQSFLWNLGMSQFLSFEEKIPSDVYLTQPYRRGRIPVVFVHGTFSSPVWWAEMANTLAADPVLRKRCQFWFFIYNSGYPTVYSARRLRESLTAKIRELDPAGTDPALQQMVVIGHSQGGLLTKLTATDTGDKLLQAVLKTNQPAALGISSNQLATIRNYTCYEALPFVKRVVFISTPHRGSYAAGSFIRNIARRLVTLPSTLVRRTGELSGLREKLDLPKELRGTPTSLDSMSPENPVLLTLADIPLAPGIKGHSIISIQGDGDFKKGKDGLVAYDSAHVDYVDSEFIVRSFHSCLAKPATIEEVRRILREHISETPAETASGADGK
jgi:pimeloyl-ACP methyl ester carboxylesterase